MKQKPEACVLVGSPPKLAGQMLRPARRQALSGFVLLLLLWTAAGCALPAPAPAGGDPPQVVRLTASLSATVTPTATATIVDTATATAVPTDTPTPLPTLTATVTPTPEPAGCKKPPEDYTRVEVNGWILNRRTLAMLEHAASLYGGELEITGYHITQGSYNTGVSASFGTHNGGGAVDLSVMRKGTWTVLWDDIERLIPALRAAGFAAWLRTYGELYSDSPYHIHAIAIGDRELSPAASEQLTGPFGYFRGYTGVPIPSGIPAPDRHGGPVLCQWMIDMGYADLRETVE